MDPSVVTEDCNLPVGTIFANTINILVKRLHRCSPSIYISNYESPTYHETIDLTFFRTPTSFRAIKDDHDSYTISGECNGLLFFNNWSGKIVICNPTTCQLKFLPPTTMKRRPNETMFRESGFGYDHVSDDYKIVRSFSHWYRDGRSKSVTEVLSLKKNYWKEIKFYFNYVVDSIGGAHVRGSYYWVAMNIDVKTDLLSFDFASESFFLLSLPSSKIHHDDYRFDTLFNFDDKLAVIIHKRPQSTRADNIFEIRVLEEGSWPKRFHITFQNDVLRPLGLKHELFFVEVKTNSQLCQLWIYNLGTGMMKSLEVYDYPGKMTVYPYIESNYHLSNEKPMDGNHIDYMDPYNHER